MKRKKIAAISTVENGMDHRTVYSGKIDGMDYHAQPWLAHWGMSFIGSCDTTTVCAAVLEEVHSNDDTAGSALKCIRKPKPSPASIQ